MGEAKRQQERLHRHLLQMADEWTFPPTVWEKAVVDALLDQPAQLVQQLNRQQLFCSALLVNGRHY